MPLIKPMQLIKTPVNDSNKKQLKEKNTAFKQDNIKINTLFFVK